MLRLAIVTLLLLLESFRRAVYLWKKTSKVDGSTLLTSGNTGSKDIRD